LIAARALNCSLTKNQAQLITVMQTINGYHAHIYFDADSFDQAEQLCLAARDRFPVQMGRMHRKPVGPHTLWSCQLAFAPDSFASVIPWLALNRDGLDIFVHPITGNDLQDHSAYAIWLGESQPLKLEIFNAA